MSGIGNPESKNFFLLIIFVGLGRFNRPNFFKLMTIWKFKIEDVTDMFDKTSKYGWTNLLPTIEYRHKYWYMWEIETKFLKWSKRVEITRADWNKG